MTEKRFQYNVNKNSIEYNGKHFAYCNGEQNKIANKLNELADENEQLKKENKELKSILQDIGLIMTNEEVKNVRDKISSKLIKPLCEENGFDVDVNTENGFTIIPKGVNNDRE